MGGAGKSATRPGMRKSTAKNSRFFSTFSPRSTVNFLALCSNFCKPLKKIRNLFLQPSPRGCNELYIGRKMANIQLFLQSREQVLVRRGEIRILGWVITVLEAQVGQLHLDCKYPARRDIDVQDLNPLGNFPMILSFKLSLKCTSRYK